MRELEEKLNRLRDKIEGELRKKRGNRENVDGYKGKERKVGERERKNYIYI